MRALLDTSVLVAGRPGHLPNEAAISVASLVELHFGVQAATSAEERAARLARLGVVEATFAPIPVDPDIARECGGLAAAARERGVQPRRLVMDLLIAATARVQGIPLITLDRDLEPLADLLELRVVA